jgi:hypothetical protein
MAYFNRGFGPSGGKSSSTYKHGSLDGRNTNFRYPSQWWDVAHMELPQSIKQMFRWCRYHALVNPIVSSVVKKMAAYPITKVIVDERAGEGFEKNKKRWEDFLYKAVDVNKFQIEVGLDYHTYGNSIVSIYYPFFKYLSCKKCEFKQRIKRLKFKKQWNFKNFDFYLTCPDCSHSGICEQEDIFYKSAQDIKIIRWNPEDILIDFNPITQVTEFAYKIPAKIRSRVIGKHLSYLEETPKNFLEGLKHNSPVILTRENVYHFKASTPSLMNGDEGWGYPPILPAMKDSFHLQIMKKAQEAVMLEHLVPLDIIYPASGDANASPYTTVNLSDWKRKIESELATWRMDPNYKPILPLPVGYQRIGGNGKQLMLTGEIQAYTQQVLVGMGVPQEFALGGLSWTGSSVSLRMLENMFLTYRDMHENFLKSFLIPNVAAYMGWEEPPVHMKSFKMADDAQNKQLLMSLNQLRKVSDQTLLAEFGKDSLSELKIIETELKRALEIQKMDTLHKAQTQAEQMKIQGAAQVEQAISQQKAQLKAQKEIQEMQAKMQAAQPQGQVQPQAQAQPQGQQQPQGQAQGQPSGVPPEELAKAFANKIKNMEETRRTQILQNMQQENPELHRLVMAALQQMQVQDQKPMPEKKPPRREGGAGI